MILTTFSKIKEMNNLTLCHRSRFLKRRKTRNKLPCTSGRHLQWSSTPPAPPQKHHRRRHWIKLMKLFLSSNQHLSRLAKLWFGGAHSDLCWSRPFHLWLFGIWIWRRAFVALWLDFTSLASSFWQNSLVLSDKWAVMKSMKSSPTSRPTVPHASSHLMSTSVTLTSNFNQPI